MERKVFTNEEIAKTLNQNFVCIKVDREERPDIDRVYMSYLQAATGSGGWPMTLFLTPDLKPFFGGTYYAPEDRNGRPGLRTSGIGSPRAITRRTWPGRVRRRR